MTAIQIQPSSEGRRYKFNVIRILFCGICLSVLVAACMYVKFTAFDFFRARLLEQESKTSAWIIKEVGFALPWIIMCIFHGLVYAKHDRHDAIVQREMFWEVLLVTIFTYLVLFPYLRNISDAMYAAALEAGADIPQTDGKVDQTFIMLFHEWFVRMTVPLGTLMVFHGARAYRERRHPDTEAVEPPMTKAEYDAKKLAAQNVSETNAIETEAEAEAPASAGSSAEATTEVARHE